MVAELVKDAERAAGPALHHYRFTAREKLVVRGLKRTAVTVDSALRKKFGRAPNYEDERAAFPIPLSLALEYLRHIAENDKKGFEPSRHNPRSGNSQ